jgi:hypothetical protein
MTVDARVANLALTFRELDILTRARPGREYVRVFRLLDGETNVAVDSLLGKGLLGPRSYTLDDYDTHGLTALALELLPAIRELYAAECAFRRRPL